MASKHQTSDLEPKTENRQTMRSTLKSCESYSTCSFNTNASHNTSMSNAVSIYSRSAVIPRRSTINGNYRSASLIPGNKEVQKRVASARRLRMKTVENRLADAVQTIADKDHELRSLHTLVSRYEAALKKYEAHNAELPQLLHSHSEEMRSLQAKCRNLVAGQKDLEHKLKQKDAVILSLQDRNKYLTQLTKEKDLEDRHRLKKKLDETEQQIKELENANKVMARKAHLEVKILKQQLRAEQLKNKELKDMQLHADNASADLISVNKFNNGPVGTRKACNTDEKTLGQQRPNQDDSSAELEARDDDSDSVLSHPTSKETVIQGMNFNRMPNTDSFVNHSETPFNVKEEGHDLNKIVRDGPLKSTSKLLSDIKMLHSQETQDSYEDDYENEIGNNNECSDAMPLSAGDTPTEDSEEYFKPSPMPGNESPQEISVEDSFASDNYTLIKEDFRKISKKINCDYKDREHFLDSFCRMTESSSSTSVSTAVAQNRSSKANYAQKPVTVTRKQKMLAAYKTVEEGGN